MPSSAGDSPYAFVTASVCAWSSRSARSSVARIRSAASGVPIGPCPFASPFAHHASSSLATAWHSIGRHMDRATCLRPCDTQLHAAVQTEGSYESDCSNSPLPSSSSPTNPAQKSVLVRSTNPSSSRDTSAILHCCRCVMAASPDVDSRSAVESSDVK